MKIIIMSMNIKFYLRLIVFTLLGLVNAQWAAAQNVTIRPQNGSMLCALTTGTPTENQLGFQIGAFGTWRHNQLSLTMTGSNYPNLTEDGQLASHSNHFISGDKCTFSPEDDTRTPENYIVADWGGDRLSTGYITIALPKGYRFTGYTFHISHDVSKFGVNNTAFSLTTNTNVYMTETDKNFSGNKNRVRLSGNSAKVEEFKRTGDDMGNVLYFTTSANNDGFYAVTFRYIELTFTADADDPIEIKPNSQVSTGTSMLEIPFNTGKVDLGVIEPGTHNNVERVSYHYNTVSDMKANMLLYEAESIMDGTGFDGTSGKVTKKESGSITTSGNYFKFAPAKKDRNDDGKIDDDDMQIYYLETPVSAKLTGTIDNPVQFRITGASVNYTKNPSAVTYFYITYKDGDDTYYLNTNGDFETETHTQWYQDLNGYIRSGNYYLTTYNNYAYGTTSIRQATMFTISGTTIKDASGLTLNYIDADNYGRFGIFTNNSSVYDYDVYPAVYQEVQSSSGSGCTIYVYDKEGENPQEITVDGTDSYPIPDLNNDAIMFGVKGGDVAFLNFDLQLQALNPYIDQMTVVLNDTCKGKNIRQTRTFTADDFSVGGDTFKFYLPKDCKHDPLTITFEDLYSKYGDETYDHTDKLGTSNSRYNFVKSQHHQAFTNDNIYNGKTEAASDQMESDRISKDQNVRTKVGTVGDKAFRFNNADELATNSGYLTEYPFTLDRYATQTKPGAGQFVEAQFNKDIINDQTWSQKTFYVFTTDETRYNIAPTTATQHRFYAFYEMIVEVLCDDYEPSVEFTKKYDKTLTEASNGGIDESSYYGVRVFVEDENVAYPLASDVATYKAISEAIKKGGDVPQDLKKILYVDMSGLNGVYHSNSTINVKNDAGTVTATYSLDSFDKLREKLAPNALIFLPVNSTDRFDNFAYAKKGEVAGSFQSANNIILTDKSPFYTPYTIQVDAANYATYKRLRTAASEDLVKKATVVLPFTMKVTNGKHKNDTEDGFEFNLRELKKLTAQTGTDQYGTEGVEEGKGNFVLITGEETKANYPYMVEVTSANGSDYSFIAAQKGSNIVATPETITGETEAETGLTNTGTYSGVKLPTTKSFFYFTKNKYVSSKTAKNKYTEIYVQPFRAYYVGSSAGSKLSMFEIVYDELEENEGLITGVTTARSHGPLTVVTGHGYMTLTSSEDINVTVCNIKGTVVANLKMTAGEQQNINVPAGVYLVNKNKVIVK